MSEFGNNFYSSSGFDYFQSIQNQQNQQNPQNQQNQQNQNQQPMNQQQQDYSFNHLNNNNNNSSNNNNGLMMPVQGDMMMNNNAMDPNASSASLFMPTNGMMDLKGSYQNQNQQFNNLQLPQDSNTNFLPFLASNNNGNSNGSNSSNFLSPNSANMVMNTMLPSPTLGGDSFFASAPNMLGSISPQSQHQQHLQQFNGGGQISPSILYNNMNNLSVNSPAPLILSPNTGSSNGTSPSDYFNANQGLMFSGLLGSRKLPVPRAAPRRSSVALDHNQYETSPASPYARRTSVISGANNRRPSFNTMLLNELLLNSPDSNNGSFAVSSPSGSATFVRDYPILSQGEAYGRAHLIEKFDVNDPESITVIDLKKILREHGCPSSGKKAVLMERLNVLLKKLSESGSYTGNTGGDLQESSAAVVSKKPSPIMTSNLTREKKAVDEGIKAGTSSLNLSVPSSTDSGASQKSDPFSSSPFISSTSSLISNLFHGSATVQNDPYFTSGSSRRNTITTETNGSGELLSVMKTSALISPIFENPYASTLDSNAGGAVDPANANNSMPSTQW